MVVIADRARVAICVPSMGREPGLRRLLTSLGEQEGDLDAATVVLVDNTREGALSARELSQVVAPLRLELVREAEPGIPAARNRAVDRALAIGAQLIAFVDDDETVPSRWLETLLGELRELDADVVAAPVRGLLPDYASPWLSEAQPFRVGDRPRGTRMATCATNNAIARAALFHTVKPWFRREFTSTGGSDAEYFARAVKAGFKIIWTDRAMAVEHVEPERATLTWVVKRGFRVGAMDAALRGHSLFWAGRGILRMARGVVEAMMALVRPQRRGLGAAASRLAEGAGNLIGAAGLRPSGYEVRSV